MVAYDLEVDIILEKRMGRQATRSVSLRGQNVIKDQNIKRDRPLPFYALSAPLDDARNA